VALAEELHSAAFDLNWTGRTLIDFGCGTGDVAITFGGRQFRVLGVDNSASMLHAAEAQAVQHHMDVRFMHGDMRTFTSPVKFDMATCLGNTLNYLSNLRDIEAMFKAVHDTLLPGKLFFFDVRTIQGMADSSGERLLADQDDVLVIARSTMNYETLALTVQYSIFHDGETGWQRIEEEHTLRGYPVSALNKLLQGAGFKLVKTFTPQHCPLDARRAEDMLVFVAVRD
jgi:cyclopropane fatty-acyl-phospholipid synthase-like methyltransferase